MAPGTHDGCSGGGTGTGSLKQTLIRNEQPGPGWQTPPTPRDWPKANWLRHSKNVSCARPGDATEITARQAAISARVISSSFIGSRRDTPARASRRSRPRTAPMRRPRAPPAALILRRSSLPRPRAASRGSLLPPPTTPDRGKGSARETPHDAERRPPRTCGLDDAVGGDRRPLPRGDGEHLVPGDRDAEFHPLEEEH